MKSWILLIGLFIFSTNAIPQSEKLQNFSELFTALKSGKQVSVIAYYAKCKLIIDSTETVAPDAVGGMQISEFEYFAVGTVRNQKAFISASETKLIHHPRRGYVLNYVRFRFYEDNSVEINARYVNPLTYETVMDETFYTKISDGANDGGVDLFRN